MAMLTLEIPGLGGKKSRNLLQKMDSIIKIARAQNPELSSILEPKVDFFRKRKTIQNMTKAGQICDKIVC